MPPDAHFRMPLELHPDDYIPKLEALVADAASLLGVEAEQTELREGLRVVAYRFHQEREVEHCFGTPKKQRAAIRQFGRKLDDAIRAFYLIAPEYTGALGAMSGNEYSPGIAPIEMERLLRILSNATKAFDAAYRPKAGAPVDLPLEDAVRRLADIVRRVTGAGPMPTMNKLNGKPQPELIETGAKAIGRLLRGIDPNLLDRTIANAILKVRTQHEPSEHPFAALFRVHPDAKRQTLAAVLDALE